MYLFFKNSSKIINILLQLFLLSIINVWYIYIHDSAIINFNL